MTERSIRNRSLRPPTEHCLRRASRAVPSRAWTVAPLLGAVLGLGACERTPPPRPNALLPAKGAPPAFTATRDGSAGRTAATEGPGRFELSDRNIEDAVVRQLVFDSGTTPQGIEVKVTDGVVTLTGSVDHLLAKDRAAAVAGMVRGVRSVIDRLTVEPPRSVPDAELAEQVDGALAADPATDSVEIDVSVTGGRVELTGTVDSWQERRLAGLIAKGVVGARGLDNQLVVAYDTDRPIVEIENEIEQALRWDAYLDDDLVEIAVKPGGKVELSGVVGSAAEKERAEALAWLAGVTAVDVEDLDVEHWARVPELRATKYAAVTDDEIRAALERAFALDPRTDEFELEPLVRDGTVLLHGEVDNLAARLAARDVALRTVGVDRVRNLIRVRPNETTDEAIAKTARRAFDRHVFLDDDAIEVQVKNGAVYLTGTVETMLEWAHAKDAVAAVNGVERVINRLGVAERRGPAFYSPYRDAHVHAIEEPWTVYEPLATLRRDTNLREEIQSELWWSPFVTANAIEVVVDDGVATLTGKVQTRAERDAAIRNAFEGGALWVDNDLEIVEGG